MPDKALHNLRRLALSEIGAVIAMGIVALGAGSLLADTPTHGAAQ